jgi:hypothetical protein
MGKLRREREAKALAFLHRHPLGSSALEIGTAAVQGELRAWAMPRGVKAAIGLRIAVELVRRGVAKPTRQNCFCCHPRRARAADASRQRASDPPLSGA